MDTLKDLRTANHLRQAEWDAGNQLSLAYRGNELAGEVGEACNVLKKLERERLGIAGSRATIGHLAEELADVLICVDLIARDLDIDLDVAVRSKFNATSKKVGLVTRMLDPPDVAAEACEGCSVALQPGDLVIGCYDGGHLHAACCGPERDSYVNLETGDPLGPDEPLPQPFAWTPS